MISFNLSIMNIRKLPTKTKKKKLKKRKLFIHCFLVEYTLSKPLEMLKLQKSMP